MKTIALFCSLPDEPSVEGLFRADARIVLPVVEGDRMFFREYTGREDLARGAFGILEPREGRVVPAGEIDVMYVPGTAFDRSGNRHGRGRGYYDRYLGRPEAAHIYKIGVCRADRLVERLDVKPHDVAMDEVMVI